MKTLLLSLFFVMSAATAKLDYTLVKNDLDIVWGMDFISPELIIFTEKSGTIKTYHLKTKKLTEISGAPKVYKRGQAGLLDIKLHPNFKENKRVYLTYSKSVDDVRTTALGYGVLEGNALKNFKEIFVGKGKSDERIHFGSRMAFTSDNKIFFTIGDRGNRPNAQNLENHFGKVLRINDDGTTPKDNPFVGNKDALAEIWSYGHRNPQGLAYDEKADKLYEMEHGPRGGDEINIVEKGKNYGWPKQSYGKEYVLPMDVGEEKVEGTEQPYKYYDPSIAPCGLVHYTGKRYKELKNSLISGALKLTHVNVVNLDTGKELRLFDDKDMRVRSVAVSPDDYIYFSTDGGEIFRINP
tara:strand:- start:20615 stop:21673 length:1059 start_codon:yes stop_codon:yes gene_type:complete